MNDIGAFIQYKKSDFHRHAVAIVDEDDSKLTKKYKKRLSGKSISQIDGEFWEYIIELLNTAAEYKKKEKNEIVEQICEYYYLQSGGYNPPDTMLGALADFLLNESLTDKDVYKIKNTEYPILSYKQRNRRRKREISQVDTAIDARQSNERYNIAHKKWAKENIDTKKQGGNW